MKFSPIIPSLAASSLFLAGAKALSMSDYVGKTIAAGDQSSIPEGTSGTVEPCSTNDSTNQVECDFYFPPMAGATMYTDMTTGSCDGVTAVDPSTSIAATSDSSLVTATEAFPAFTAEEKNSGQVVQTYCARADVYDNEQNISVVAALVEINTTFTFDSTGSFSTSVATALFDAEDATADATRTVSLSAHFGPCGSPVDPPTDGVAIGSTLQICAHISDADADVKISGIHSVTLKDANQPTAPALVTPVDENYAVNFVSTLDPNVNDANVADASGVTIETLMVPKIYDAGATQIVVEGTADLVYSRRRRLVSGNGDVRELEEEVTSQEAFAILVELKEKELPMVASVENGGSVSVNGVGVGLIGFVAGVVALV